MDGEQSIGGHTSRSKTHRASSSPSERDRLSAEVERAISRGASIGLTESGSEKSDREGGPGGEAAIDEDLDDEEEEEEEEEPRLKYQRVSADVADIFAGNAASCLCVSDKLLALGVHDGTVHVLDIAGNEVKRFEVHKSKVNDISMDESGEFLASCSDDGSAAVHGLYSEESARFKYNQPIKTVALDPRFGQRKTREFISGGLSGQLLFHSKGWLGNRDTVLHSGEGPINVARWQGHLIAWANDRGVKVYDTSSHKIVGFLPAPAPSGVSSEPTCKLFWEQPNMLYIGWSNTVKVAKVSVPHQTSANASHDNQLVVEIEASFKLEDCLVAGIAPFGKDIAMLTYALEPSTPFENGPANGAEKFAPRPELKVVDWHNNEKASDALSINGYEHYQASDYTLEVCYKGRRAAPPDQAAAQAGDFTKWWKDGDEPSYYLVCPKDLVVGRPRDSEDRIDWQIEHERYEEALELADKDISLKSGTRQKVAQAYLENLLKEGKFQEAASLCPRLLKDDSNAWERWVYLFAQIRQLGVLAPYLPTAKPQLRRSAYEMVLHAFLLSPADHERLFQLLKTWPSSLYSVQSMTHTILQRIRGQGGDSEALLEAAAYLYQMQARYDLTLAILLRLKRESVFEFIKNHHLLPMLKESSIPQLVSIDSDKAVELFVDCNEEISTQIVVPAIQAAMREANQRSDKEAADLWQRRLHDYLDRLFRKDTNAGAAYHSLQVALYAEYEPSKLMPLLVTSQSYGLEAAHDLCKKKGLVREHVFILGRMGNVQEALHLIIQDLADIPQAIEFVQMQEDDELWDVLIDLVLGSESLTGLMLDNIGSYINPQRLIEKIPKGMVVERLRDRLVTIIAEFRSQTSLEQCCSTILQKDCLYLAQRMYTEIKMAVGPASLYIKSSNRSGEVQWWCQASAGGSALAVDVSDLPGPFGAKTLHIVDSAPELPKVWIGYSDAASIEPKEVDPSIADKRNRRRSSRKDDKTKEHLECLV